MHEKNVPEDLDLAASTHAPTHAPRVGRFVYWVGSDHWWWSAGMYRIHGFEPGEIVPSTDLVRSHQHPDDLKATAAVQCAAIENEEPFTSHHRIYDAQRRLRVVLTAGYPVSDGDEIEVHGHLIDLTDARGEGFKAELDHAVADFAAHRAVIEQAKGVLMQLLSVDEVDAFAILRAYSQSANIKVRDLASLVVEAASENRTPTKGSMRGRLVEALDCLVDAMGALSVAGARSAASAHLDRSDHGLG